MIRVHLDSVTKPSSVLYKPLVVATNILFGLSGRIPFSTNLSNITPENIAITNHKNIKDKVQNKPIKEIKIIVSDSEFQGLAIKNAIT